MFYIILIKYKKTELLSYKRIDGAGRYTNFGDGMVFLKYHDINNYYGI